MQWVIDIWIWFLKILPSFIYPVYIFVTAPSLLSPQFYPYTSFPILSSAFLRCEDSPHGNKPSLAHKLSAWLGTSLPTEVRQASTSRGKESKRRQQCRRQTSMQLIGNLHEDLMHIFHIWVGGTGPAHECSLTIGSVSVRPLWPQFLTL